MHWIVTFRQPPIWVYTVEQRAPRKKSKAKQNKKTEKRKKKKERKKPIKAENSRILLKTIPNENKYKTKLKKMCITWHQLFSGWQYFLMKTFSWLPFIPTPSPEVTRGWSKLAFLMQTLWGWDVNVPCRWEFAGLCGTRDPSPILPLPFFSIHITLVHKWKFSKSSQAPKN